MKYIIWYYIIGFFVSLFFIWFYRFSNVQTTSKPKKTDSLGGLIGVWLWPFQIILGFRDIVKWINGNNKIKSNTMKTFKNSFYQKDNPYSHEYYEYNDSDFIENYYGYDIYHHSYSSQYDIVKDGVIIGNYAGLNGARRRIDELS